MLRNKIKKVLSKILITPFLKYCGHNSYIISPLKIVGKKNILIGSNVIVEYKTWLAADDSCNSDCELIIKDGCNIGHFNHIYAMNKIILEKNVLTADKVYITDNIHGYSKINIPIKDQDILLKKEVIIGEGSWLGENVCILGASVGKNCVIGANAVVTKDIPDYCIAVGNPAQIIKQYDKKIDKWKQV